MNFNWANELAKSALKNAQKKIDSVLDITPEDEEEENDATSTAVGVENASSKHVEEADESGWEAQTVSFYSAYGDDANVEVVDSEPNPIRDSHNATLLPHSPCSNSPGETVCSGEEQEGSHANVTTKEKGSALVDMNELSALVEEKNQIKSEASQKNGKHHDDAVTVISSDIEVLRLSDACSMASSVQQKVFIPVAPNLEQHSRLKDDGSSSGTTQTTHSEIAQLKMQIQHQERRIRDLQAQNKRLESKSNELLAVKAARNQQSTTEAKLLKKLSEKETELADLLREGEKLAEMNGKLSKELKRLKSCLNEQEQLAKKGLQAEIDRDLAREEVRGLTAETTKLRAAIKTLEEDLSEMKVVNEVLMADIKKRDEKVTDMTAAVQQSEASRELALEEIKRLENVIEEITSKADEREFSSKNVEELTRGLSADLQEERLKTEQQASYISSLEKRLGDMMEAQRDTAQMIATANAPLLESIERLHVESAAKEEAYDATIREKDVTIREMQKKEGKLLRENSELFEEIKKLRAWGEESSGSVNKLNGRMRHLEEQNRRLRSEQDRLQQMIESLKASLKDRETETEKAYIRLSEETTAFERRYSEKQKQFEIVSERCEELERRLNKTMEYNEGRTRRRQESEGKTEILTNGSIRPKIFSYTFPTAAQVELAEVSTKYDQALRQISSLEARLANMEAESKRATTMKNELQDLKMRYESLLEAHGEKIERIEELQLDLADVKKLYKDQIEFFLGKG